VDLSDAGAGMTPYTLHHGDCLDILRTMPDASIDAVVTDPPYGLSFMNKAWDHAVPGPEVWRECLRVMKPGAHLLAFAGTRTQHRMACAIEDAGFEIRDMIAWVYGSGFPKSLDVSKAIDAAAGAEREVVGQRRYGDGHVQNSTKLAPPIGTFQRTQDDRLDTAPATPEAQQWAGWGTALKPALEPITVARKPLIGTVAANVLAHGTGAINVDGCRVGAAAGDEPLRWEHGRSMGFHGAEDRGPCQALTSPGRFPANLIHDGSDEAAAPFGDAARFFYCAKASQEDRNAGCDHLPERAPADRVDREEGSDGMASPRAGAGRTSSSRNHHPTVKPTDLMRYLCRLVTPPGGVVLDPFMGSGSTGRAAIIEGFRFVGCDLDSEYIEIARARIEDAILPLFRGMP
jgi:DNA modification methylase